MKYWNLPMNEERTKHSGAEFERQDLEARPIFAFLIGLALVCLLVYFMLKGMYGLLEAREKAHQPPQNPLVAVKPQTGKPTTEETSNEIRKDFPEPRLEHDERGQLNNVLLQEEKTLNSYGWVDEKTGVVHIPIERAMQLVAQRGLPTRPPNSIAATNSSGEKAGGKTTAARKEAKR
jgi:hypothetical protein